MSFPNTPVVVSVNATLTNATITFSVERIAYTNESYVISFRGEERDMEERKSNTVSGTLDIIAVNSEYTISLRNLEENTIYYYTVTAINCIGNTSTAEMNFTTLSNCKFSHSIIIQHLPHQTTPPISSS